MRRVVLVSFILALLGLSAVAQQQQPNTPQGQGTIRVGTQLVVETVMVKDRNGKAVEGLTAQDFSVTEDGAPQTISFVEFERLEDVRSTPAGPSTPAPAPINPVAN